MRLVIVQGPKEGEFPLQDGEFIAGRDPANALHLPSKRVSRQHCTFAVQGERCVVRDMGSSNGVIVDGQRVESAELLHGSRLQLGDYVLAFQIHAGERIAEPQIAAPSLEPPFEPEGESLGAAFGAPIEEGAPFGGGAAQDGAWNTGALVPGAFGGGEIPAEPEAGNPFGVPLQDGPGFEPDPAGGVGGLVSDDVNPGGAGFSGGGAGGFGFDASASRPELMQPQVEESAEELEGLMLHVETVKKAVGQLPWLARLGGIMFLGVLFTMLAPVGGVLAMLGQADLAMERLAVQQGVAMAQILASNNGPVLAKGKESQLKISSVSTRVGVEKAWVTGGQGFVKAPVEKRGRSLKGHPLFNQAFETNLPAHQFNEEGRLEVIVPVLESIQGLSPGIVGYTYLEYDTDKVVDSVGKPAMRAIAGLVLVLIVFVGLFFSVWQLSSRPVRAVQQETELAIRGHVSQVRAKVRWDPLEDLAHSINRALERIGGGEGSLGSQGSGGGELKTVLEAVPDPLLVLDANLNVVQANKAALHMLQVDSAVLGSPVSVVVTDPGLSGRLQHMLQCIGAEQGNIFSDHVSVGGQARRLTVAGLPVGGGRLAHAVVVVT